MPPLPGLRQLPLLLVAAMLVLAVAFELALSGEAELLVKAPLAALLAAAFWRARGAKAAS